MVRLVDWPLGSRTDGGYAVARGRSEATAAEVAPPRPLAEKTDLRDRSPPSYTQIDLGFVSIGGSVNEGTSTSSSVYLWFSQLIPRNPAQDGTNLL